MSGQRMISAGLVATLLAFSGTLAWGQTVVDTFDNDIAGSPPANWSVNAGAGTSANVGPNNVVANKYLELRDLSSDGDLSVERDFGPGDTQGFFRFDIRANQIGNTSTLTMF